MSGNRFHSTPSREKVMSRIARMSVGRRGLAHSSFNSLIFQANFRPGKEDVRSADSGRWDSGSQRRVLPVSLM